MNNGPIERYSFGWQVPEGDNRERHVCTDCGWIVYVNPKIVVGAVVSHGDRILLCRRAIEPRLGYWTIPAGYMEERETTEQGAIRETLEEANARIEIDALLALYNIPRISQVQVIYRARLPLPEFSAGPESQAVELFHWQDIPWADLAFPSVHWALRHYRETIGKTVFAPFSAPVGGWR